MKVNETRANFPYGRTSCGNGINNNQTKSFKGLDNFCLWTADLIENGGLAVSFTLQDMLGTNFPRPVMGLVRNKKENKGKKNFSFAAKEFVREFLTGPSMFIIPGVMLWGANKMFGKASGVPVNLLKGFGGIHKENAAKYTASNAKQSFYNDAFAEMIKNAKGENEISKETIKQAADFSSRLQQGINSTDKKGLSNAIDSLFDSFVLISKQHSDDAVHADFTAAKLSADIQAPFKKTVSHMISYADDAVVKASKQSLSGDKLKEFITKMTNKKITGRFALNIAMYSAVMTFLQLIPKLYNTAEGKNNAGLKGLMTEETFNDKELNARYEKKTERKKSEAAKNKSNPSFGSAASFADKITGSGVIGNFAKNWAEYDGLNLSFPFLNLLMLGGILYPRTKQAKDKYDREEILRRDVVSCAVMTLGAKELEKGFSKYNESRSGFVLASKDKGFYDKNIFGRFFDYIRPIGGVRMLSTDKIRSKYTNIDQYKNGIQGFCDFLAGHGGNLGKVFSLTDESKKIMNDILKSTGKDIASADNKTIMQALADAKKEDVQKLADLFKNKDNPWVKRARTLNGRFTTLAVLVLVPLFLGFMLPAINERATKRRIKEELASKEAEKSSGGINSGSNNFDFMKKEAKKSSVFAGMDKYTR